MKVLSAAICRPNLRWLLLAGIVGSCAAHCAAAAATDEPGVAAAPPAGRPTSPECLGRCVIKCAMLNSRVTDPGPDANHHHMPPDDMQMQNLHPHIALSGSVGEGKRPLGTAIAMGDAQDAGPGAGRPRAPLAPPAAAGCTAWRRRGMFLPLNAVRSLVAHGVIRGRARAPGAKQQHSVSGPELRLSDPVYPSTAAPAHHWCALHMLAALMRCAVCRRGRRCWRACGSA